MDEELSHADVHHTEQEVTEYIRAQNIDREAKRILISAFRQRCREQHIKIRQQLERKYRI